MLSRLPKLRDDLVLRGREEAGATTFVLKDPATRRFFRFGEAEHCIARLLDGSRTLDEVRRSAEEALGEPLEEGTVEEFARSLDRLGLLEGWSADPIAQAPARGRIRGSLLYLRFNAFDPDRLLECFSRKVGFFFTPWFLWISLLLVGAAAGVMVTRSGEIARELPRLFRLDALALAWVVVLLVTAAHELAHGLACKRFGGEVREMGFMLIYFQPALYCNVSDAWLFPDRSRRLWVTFAGAYFEIVLWAGAVLVWRMTEPGTGAGFLGLIVMATSGVKTLFNLNPLIKLDGYYLLSDLLDIPNLRARAFGWLRARLAGPWRARREELDDLEPRRGWIYPAYGLLAAVYSVSLLSFLAVQVGSYLTHRYQALGSAIYAALLVAAFGGPLKNAVASGGGRIPKRARRAAWAALLAAACGWLAFGRMELRTSGEFTILPFHNADVRAQVEGRIHEILVDEGDRVREGDLIATLWQDEIELLRKQLEAARTKEAFARERRGAAGHLHQSRLSRSRAEASKAAERLLYARRDLERARSLFEAQLLSRQQLEEAEQRAAMAEKELEVARAEQRMVGAEDLAQAEEEMALARKEAEQVEARLRNVADAGRPARGGPAIFSGDGLQARDDSSLVAVPSPASGIITTPRLKERIGEQVKKGDLIAEVHEMDVVTAEIKVPEKEIGEVKVGQLVALKARAYPEVSFRGTVTSIAPAAVQEPPGWGERLFRVTTVLDNPSLKLRPGMTGAAKISCGRRPVHQLATRRIARYLRVEFWSWW